MDKDSLHKNLIISILALASDKQNQLDFTAPGCTVCDLIVDFDMYGNGCYDKSEYNEQQNHSISDLTKLVDSFIALETECFDTDVLDYLHWIEVRNKAKETLFHFGYQLNELPKSIQTSKGSWVVDTKNYVLKKLDK